MGGKLLFKVFRLPENRIGKEAYLTLLERVLEEGKEFRIEQIKTFTEKESFSDLDVLIESTKFGTQTVPKLIELFGPQCHINGNVISFPIDFFQVDFILTSEEIFECAQFYYSFEIGNILGTIAKRLGFTLKHKGLYLNLPLRELSSDYPANQFHEFLITRAPAEIVEILGYSSLPEEFANKEELYQWIAGGKYFNSSIFEYSELNHVNRTRNRKRPVYDGMVEFCRVNVIENNLPKQEFIKKYSQWGDIPAQIEEVKKAIERKRIIKSKFNGEIVRELTGREGAALGEFICAFTRHREDFQEWLLTAPIEEIYTKILNFSLANF